MRESGLSDVGSMLHILKTGFVIGLLNVVAACSVGDFGQRTVSANQFAASETQALRLPPELIDVIGQGNGRRAIQAQLSALQNGKTGIPIVWRYSSSDKTGRVVPGPDYSINGRGCRDFNHIVEAEGARREYRGVACQRPDGTWQSLES